MKKLLCLALAALCLLAAIPAALAAGSTYELPDLDMTIDAPDGWVTFTQDNDLNDPNFALLGLDAKTLTDYYKENKIYINMISSDPVAEIVVTMGEDNGSRDTYDLNRIPDSDMQSQAESLMQEMQKLMKDQVTYSDPSVYKHKQATFAIFHLTQEMNGQTVYGKQFTTVINGKVINITLHSYEGEITDELSQILQNTIDSVHFTKVTSKPSTLPRSLLIGAAAGGIAAVVVVIIRKRKKKNNPPGAEGGQPQGGSGNTNIM